MNQEFITTKITVALLALLFFFMLPLQVSANSAAQTADGKPVLTLALNQADSVDADEDTEDGDDDDC